MAGAILEELSRPSSQVMGIFATHLHELFSLPLLLTNNVVRKTMMVNISSEDSVGSDDKAWTYRLLDGVCTDSLALHTARVYKLPDQILRRAKELAVSYDRLLQLAPVASQPMDEDAQDATPALPAPMSRLNSCTLHDLIPRIHCILHQYAYPQMAAEEVHLMLHTIVLERSELAPAHAQASHCVYVLELQPHSQVPKSYYIGETASIHQRLTQHRQTYNHYHQFRVLILHFAGTHSHLCNRSHMRFLESLLIMHLKSKYNVDICNSAMETNRILF